jgi:dihydropyrimidinase
MRVAGGLVVTPDGARVADVTVQGNRIAAITRPAPGGDLDARGCLVLPGGVDPHTHLLADVVAATTAAVHGGTTTTLSFTAPRTGESSLEAFVRASKEAVPASATTLRLHVMIAAPERLGHEELERLAAVGAGSIKLFLAYGELGLQVPDRVLYETLRDSSRLGLLTMVHCENGGAIEARVAEALADGRCDPRAFAWTRPPLVEEEAVARTLALARLADAPVYLVHLSCSGSLELVRAARRRGQRVWAEACTHHLLLDDSLYERPDAQRWVIAPPLRPAADVEALWAGIEDGTIDCVGSDHAQALYRPDVPPGDFRSIPYGFSGIELRVPLVLAEGRTRDIPVERLAGVLATGPAQAFGLADGRGTLAPGAMADLVVWDPSAAFTVVAADLHDGLGYSPFDGLRVQGRVRTVVQSGRRVGLTP